MTRLKTPDPFRIPNSSATLFYSVQAPGIVYDMISVAGERYGWESLLRVAAHYTPFVRHWVRPDENDIYETIYRPICSEAVAMCYRRRGIDLVPNLADRSTEPVHLARSGLLVYQFTIGRVDEYYTPPPTAT